MLAVVKHQLLQTFGFFPVPHYVCLDDLGIDVNNVGLALLVLCLEGSRVASNRCGHLQLLPSFE